MCINSVQSLYERGGGERRWSLSVSDGTSTRSAHRGKVENLLEQKLELGLTQSDVRRMIKRLPLSDSLAALDYMLRELWEGKEYSGVEVD
jgi:hypothetical protein